VFPVADFNLCSTVHARAVLDSVCFGANQFLNPYHLAVGMNVHQVVSGDEQPSLTSVGFHSPVP